MAQKTENQTKEFRRVTRYRVTFFTKGEVIMDTAVLIIPKGKYRILDIRRFNPYFYPINSLDELERINFLQENKGFKKYLQNPKASLRDEGLVYPNLRIEERVSRDIYSCDLKISFSYPKILWAHSFEEVIDALFQTLIETLKTRLEEMGVEVSLENLRTAAVHTLHFCANIKFPSLEEAQMFLNRLSKVSLKAWFENNDRTFSNGGHAVRFHTDIFEIVFYLKYYDVLETGNKSVGRKTTRQEKETAKRLLKEGRIPPVVRMEIRFNGTRSVRNHLKATLDIDKQFWTFEEVFDFLNSRKALKYYWNQIINDPINKAYLCTTSDEDICRKVLDKYKGVTTKDISEALGLFYFVKNLGVRGTKEIIILRQNRKAWYDKRKKIINFAKRFVNQDEKLLKIVTSVLENKPVQLGLPL